MSIDNTKAVPLTQPTILPDGTMILSGPVPGGQVAQATQVTPRSEDAEPLRFMGIPGGPFTIIGSGFGPVGMVHVGNTQVTVTSWRSHRIKGLLPPALSAKQDALVTDGAGNKIKVPYVEPPVPQPMQALTPAAAKA